MSIDGKEPKVADAAPDGRRAHLGEIAEDASGFGLGDLRLIRDMFVRPRAVMAAYDAEGSTAGGRYPRPLRFYLALNGLFLLFIALLGGFESAFQTMPAEALDALLRTSGKSRDEFLADLDQWTGMLSIPGVTLILAAPLYQVIKRWSPLDSRTDFHQTFSFLNAWTLYQMPMALLMLLAPQIFMILSAPVMLAAAGLAFALLGKDRWWTTARGAWLKGLVLLVLITVLMIPASLVTYGLGLAAAVYLP